MTQCSMHKNEVFGLSGKPGMVDKLNIVILAKSKKPIYKQMHVLLQGHASNRLPKLSAIPFMVGSQYISSYLNLCNLKKHIIVIPTYLTTHSEPCVLITGILGRR